MKRLVIIALTLLAIGFHPQFAAADDGHGQLDARAHDNYVELQDYLSKRADRPRPEGKASVPRLVRTYVPACQGNLMTARRNAGVVCDQARQVCATTPTPDDLGYWMYTALAGTEDWTTTGQVVCRGGAPEDGAVAEPVVTAQDFRRLPIPAAGLEVQPGDRRTLVNVPTNLYARSEPTILRTSILGFPIRVRATPSVFHWRYGDGGSLRTANAGGPYPRLDTAHTYQQKGHRTVSLATEYAGEYSVDGGPWQPIDGTATVASPSISLTVEEARAHLVS